MNEYKMIANSSAEALAEKIFKNSSELAQAIANNILESGMIKVNSEISNINSDLTEAKENIGTINNSLPLYIQREYLANEINTLIYSAIEYEQHKDQDDADDYLNTGLHLILKTDLDNIVETLKTEIAKQIKEAKENNYAALASVLEQVHKNHKIKVSELNADFLNYCKEHTTEYTFATTPDSTEITFTE